MYDVIVIGARVAGSPLAMLLARLGMKVLLVDRATFPSDTLSTHMIQLTGTAALKRLGLLELVLDTHIDPVRQLTFTLGDIVLQGKYPPLEEVDTVISPRRFILDKLLVNAAVQAGAELRQGFLVDELLFEGDKVTGIRGHIKSSQAATDKKIDEHAHLIVGADGKHSFVARGVQAEEYYQTPAQTCAYYTYWAGLQLNGGEVHNLTQGVVGVFPTNGGLAVIYTAYPVGWFAEVRGDIEGRFWRTMDALPELAERVHKGRQAERFFGTADLPAFYRKAYGPGWALAGDARMSMDPITGAGIGHALRDAELLAKAIGAALGGQADFEAAMKSYQQQREAESLPMYKFTSQLAAFLPLSVEQQVFFSALRHKPKASEQFFGALTGSVPVDQFFSPSSVRSIVGMTGLARVMLSKVRLPWKSQAREESQ